MIVKKIKNKWEYLNPCDHTLEVKNELNDKFAYLDIQFQKFERSIENFENANDLSKKFITDIYRCKIIATQIDKVEDILLEKPRLFQSIKLYSLFISELSEEIRSISNTFQIFKTKCNFKDLPLRLDQHMKKINFLSNQFQKLQNNILFNFYYLDIGECD